MVKSRGSLLVWVRWWGLLCGLDGVDGCCGSLAVVVLEVLGGSLLGGCGAGHLGHGEGGVLVWGLAHG